LAGFKTLSYATSTAPDGQESQLYVFATV